MAGTVRTRERFPDPVERDESIRQVGRRSDPVRRKRRAEPFPVQIGDGHLSHRQQTCGVQKAERLRNRSPPWAGSRETGAVSTFLFCVAGRSHGEDCNVFRELMQAL